MLTTTKMTVFDSEQSLVLEKSLTSFVSKALESTINASAKQEHRFVVLSYTQFVQRL